jgi:hypothetical protein
MVQNGQTSSHSKHSTKVLWFGREVSRTQWTTVESLLMHCRCVWFEPQFIVSCLYKEREAWRRNGVSDRAIAVKSSDLLYRSVLAEGIRGPNEVGMAKWRLEDCMPKVLRAKTEVNGFGRAQGFLSRPRDCERSSSMKCDKNPSLGG